VGTSPVRLVTAVHFRFTPTHVGTSDRHW